MLFGLGWFLDRLAGLRQKATVMRIFFTILPILDMYSNIKMSVLFSDVLIGMKKLKKVPAQYINNAETSQNSNVL